MICLMVAFSSVCRELENLNNEYTHRIFDSEFIEKNSNN